jgi:hypothetical protein
MRVRPFILSAALFIAAFLLVRAAITHNGVGLLEYTVMAVLIVGFLGAAVRLSRRATHRV